MKHANDILKSVMVTEKGTTMQESENRYMLRVAKAANKTEIKKAVEDFFNVRCTDSALQVVQLDWDTAARADTMDKVRENIAVLLFFLIGISCFRCNCNDWFSHRLNPPLYCLGIRLADRPLIHAFSISILNDFFPFVNTQNNGLLIQMMRVGLFEQI